jgi:hypothetical protein
MTINSAAILKLQEVQETTFKLLLSNGDPCREIGVEELTALATAGHVCARWRGGRIRSVQLIVPADVAFRGLGETARLIKDLLHSDASRTTQRASSSLPSFVRRHHPARSTAFASSRQFAEGGFIDREFV